MPYTTAQKLRKMRATNKGSNVRIAAFLRRMAEWLEKKGNEEFSRREIKNLKLLREALTARLYANAVTKTNAAVLADPEKYRVEDGYKVELDKNDL